MNSNLKKSVMVGVLFGAAAVYADIIVDDFTAITNKLTDGAGWTADGDTWPAIGGTSHVRPLAPDTSDLVKGDSYSGDNTAKAYADDGTLSSRIFVTADVSATKKWAYAGWVMDFITPKPQDTTKPVYELNSWEKYQEVDVSSCTSLELTLQFDAGRILWVDLFSPRMEKANANFVPVGWRYTGTGAQEVKKFNLGGVTGPAPKWADPANTVPLDLHTVTRLRILYEGMQTGSATAMYDTVGHILKLAKVRMLGTSCAITENRGASLPIAFHDASKHNVSFNTVNGGIRFENLATVGELKTTVRNLNGTVVAQGIVNTAHPSVDVSALKNGVYTVQASNAKFNRTGTVTLLK